MNKDQALKWLDDKLIRTDSVLDIGSGIKPQRLFKPKIHICVDPFKPYLDKLQNGYVKLNCDWETVTKIFPERSVETVTILDVIEHLEKDEGKRLLALTERIATRQLLIFTPFGFMPSPRGDLGEWQIDGGHWQEHKSGWMPEDFEGYETVTIDDRFNLDGKRYDAIFAIKTIT